MGYSDWAVDWGTYGDLFQLRFTIVHPSQTLPITVLTEVIVTCNEAATKRYQQFEEAGLDWIGRNVIAEMLFDIGKKQDIRFILDSQLPQKKGITNIDPKTNAGYEVHISSRKMGEDNGKDQLIDISDNLMKVREYMRATSRMPTREESDKMIKIMASPFSA